MRSFERNGSFFTAYGRLYNIRIGRIRLPPVLGHETMWHGGGSWFVLTTRGLAVWGDNEFGQLGTGATGHRLEHPAHLTFNDVKSVQSSSGSTFFKRTGGWYACGKNDKGQLGLGHTTSPVVDLTLVPGSEGIEDWMSGRNRNFACFAIMHHWHVEATTKASAGWGRPSLSSPLLPVSPCPSVLIWSTM